MYQLDNYTYFFFMVILPIIAKKSKSGKIICFVIFLLICIYEFVLMYHSFFK